jgi:cation-transporting P-type ATPase E
VTTRSPGVSEEEARRRLAERGPIEPAASSRSYRSIVRANTLTVFNAILVAFGVLTLMFADWRDALFLFILVANSGIGIAQEVRAKRSLDRLAALVAPRAAVVRDGSARELPVEDVVPGDLVELRPGDQVVADGQVEEARGLLLDESILTGESRHVARGPGDEIRSGSFAVEGSGAYTVTAVGPDSYAERLAGEAREFRHPRSPLETSLNQLLLILVAVMVPLGAALGYALWERNEPFRSSVETAVAGAVSMVPEGLILLVSITYAAAALRMTRRGALAQQLNAIESIASVDVVCLDKTGTLTEPSIRVLETVPAAGVADDERSAASPSGHARRCRSRLGTAGAAWSSGRRRTSSVRRSGSSWTACANARGPRRLRAGAWSRSGRPRAGCRSRTRQVTTCYKACARWG